MGSKDIVGHTNYSNGAFAEILGGIDQTYFTKML